MKHKFNAKPTDYDGYRYDSKLEARYAAHLNLLKSSGEVLFFLRQVPFHLAPNLTYRVDFQIFYKSGDVEFVDVKGMETPDFISKLKLVEHQYPVKIKIVKKGDF